MDFGILSLGNHAVTKVIPAILRSGNRITSIYSTHKDKGTRFSKLMGSEYYDDLEKFFKSNFEAVYISSPNFLHYNHAKMALAHGKWVLLEKPMTLRIEDSLDLHETYEKNGLPLKIGFHLRFHPALKEVYELISSDKIGNLKLIEGKWTHFSSHDLSNSWWGKDEMAGGGSIVGTGVHIMDTILKLMRDEIYGLFGISNPRNAVIENQFDIILVSQSGLTAHVVSSRKIPQCCNDLNIFGEEGEITVKNFFSTEVNAILEFEGKTKKFKGVDMYEMEIRDFVSNGETIANSWDGVISTALHIGSQISSKEGKFITLRELLGR